MSDPHPKLDYASKRRAVPLIRVGSPAQAHLIALLLERAGIACLLLNENAAALGSPYDGAGIEIQVRPEDQERAEAIVRDMLEGRVPVAEEEGEEAPRCPKCRSWQVREQESFWEDLLRFFHLIPHPPTGVDKLECRRCGHQWVEMTSEKVQNPRP
jgi:hypothetical protein